MRQCALALFALGLPLYLGACQGSWAQHTAVHIEPLRHSHISGLVIVSQGRTCDEYRCSPHGTLVIAQLLSGDDRGSYRFFAARGSCLRPPAAGTSLASADGAHMKDNAAGTLLELPIIEFTGGDYVIVLARNGKQVACGVVRRAGFV